jgi:hypothetical protein
MKKKNVFLIGLNAFNRAKLQTISDATDYAFHGLLEEPHHYRVEEVLAEAESALRAFPGSIDAVVGYMDFPVSTMLPILCSRFGLRSPSLESVLRCEHKYWSRLEQSRVIGEHVPDFALIDPFDENALAEIPLAFPFWMKPVKAAASYLGFRITNRDNYVRAIEATRENIAKLAEPFNFVLGHADLPAEIAPIDGYHCIAEQIISGSQCTLEGCMFEGEMLIHGVVDSVREPNHSSFARYQYPSRLPMRIQRDMARIAEKFLHQVGFDNSGFNIEFFWDKRRDKVWLLEVNTRVAQHHSDLFEKVDGTTNHEVPIKVALGRRPHIPHREGAFRCAATFFLRTYSDAYVETVPSAAQIHMLAERYPGTVVQLQVRPGDRLSTLHEQDSYSYALAIIYVGADSESDMLRRYRECVAALPFDLVETKAGDCRI